MLQEALAQIGLSTKEAQIYLELLTIGPQAVSVISKRIGLNRSTTYCILKSLEEKGLVSSCRHNNVRFCTANDPNCLIGFLDGKCKTFDYYKSELMMVIPHFRSLMASYNFKKPLINYYDGMEGVKYVIYDALSTKGDFCAYLCLHKWFEHGMKDFLLHYKDFRIATKKIPLRAMAPDTKEVRDFFEQNYDKKNSLTKILYVKDASYLEIFKNEMNIYDNKVAIIHLDKGQEYGVIIENKEIADMHKSIFEMAWRGSGGK